MDPVYMSHCIYMADDMDPGCPGDPAADIGTEPRVTAPIPEGLTTHEHHREHF
jgi:hypothetical protein